MQGRLEGKEGTWWLDWGVAQSSKYERCGDGYLLLRDEDTVAAIVADGVGSGNEAHRISNTAILAAKKADSFDAFTLFNSVHTRLKSETRGAAMAVAVLDFTENLLTWAAIGDIDGVLSRPSLDRLSLIQRNGTLGVSDPMPMPTQEKIVSGANLVLVTDGIKSGFRNEAPQQKSKTTAKTILATHGRSNDDCSCLCLMAGIA